MLACFPHILQACSVIEKKKCQTPAQRAGRMYNWKELETGLICSFFCIAKKKKDAFCLITFLLFYCAFTTNCKSLNLENFLLSAYSLPRHYHVAPTLVQPHPLFSTSLLCNPNTNLCTFLFLPNHSLFSFHITFWSCPLYSYFTL